jgi:acetylornithine deacetylase/succinyl-diaminopimelate desuccinylase-like protein
VEHDLTRETAIKDAEATFDDGTFLNDLGNLVSFPTESQDPASGPVLRRYLDDAMRPWLEGMGYSCQVMDNPQPQFGPFLLAERIEDTSLPTVLTYGHGDVVGGQDDRWQEGLDPWTLTQKGDRLYGRGTADNKGQHAINMTALRTIIKSRGKLGFNSKILIETGEETGSPGLAELFQEKADLFRSDVLIASDGPRVDPARPTLFMGSRGAINFELKVDLREGAHHSGNWGGLLRDPGIVLSHAIASITDRRGQIRVPEWRPDVSLTPAVRAALADIELNAGENAPEVDTDWGEEALTPSERVWGWNSFAVLAITSGIPERPQNAIAPAATAWCQLRFVVGTDLDDIVPALRRHLAAEGFDKVEVTTDGDVSFNATRLDPDHPWVEWTAQSVRRTTGKSPAILPNLGGSLPNELFAHGLGLPTIWVPHSYAGCSQHAPNEHALASTTREALAIMTGIFWDLGEGNTPHSENSSI